MAYNAVRREIVLFGGQGSFSQYLNDTWVWNGTNWTQKNPLNSPPPRQLAAMSYDAGRGEVVLFGGYLNGSGILNDTWVWNGIDWTQRAPANRPPPLYVHAMAYDTARGQVVLFGGADAAGQGHNETWIWNGTDWAQRHPANSPAPRYEPTMAYDATHMEVVLFGGNPGGGGGYYGDTWVWNGTNWTQRSPANCPPPRAGHAMAYDASHGEVVLLGGDVGINDFRDDTWVWNGTNWTQRNPVNTPAPRLFHAMAYDAAHGTVVLFGGQTCNCNSTWTWPGDSSTLPADSVPFSPQKIFLAFNQPSSFSAGFLFKFNKWFPKTFPLGSNPAEPMANSSIISVTSKIKDIFDRSGVHNIDWAATDSADAIAVYFCPTLTPDIWYGITLGRPDQFNSKRRGECIVFVTGDDQVDAASAAHEIGHALGLQHVDPNTGIDPLHDEVMQTVGDFTGPSPRFINAVTVGSDSSLSRNGTTHNPLYHLLRYVDGWSQAQLQSAGITPGSWDSGTPTTVRFSFQNANLRLHNITVFASGGNTEATYMLEQIPSATLSELSEHSFTVPEGMGIVLLASSTTNGEPDVISSTGDPFVSTNQIVSADSPTNTFSLFLQDSPTSAVAVSTATAAFDAQTRYCNISLSAPAILRLDFRGTLQSSTNLTDWADVGAVSPHFIIIGPSDKAGFFRSRQ